MHAGKNDLSFYDVEKVAFGIEKIFLDLATVKNILKTRVLVDKAIKEKKIIYGITTGFGAFKNTFITSENVRKLQKNLILSHAVGVGSPFDETTVRGIMFLIVNYLSKGYSGIRPIVVETLIEMLNRKVYPFVPQQGSVGSSGDLAPSAHIILVLIGQGEAFYQGKLISGELAMKKAKIKPVVLEAKEGLALVNNTATMTSVGSLALAQAFRIADFADVVSSLSCEALRATTKAFDPRIHQLKPHSGQILVAKRLREFLKNSTMIDNLKIQDQYSLRCIPQIHGAVREALNYVTHVINTEINSVTDNPLILNDDILSGGNFHGEAVAIAMDTLAIAMSELANVSDRRIASLLDPATNNGLPAFLAEKGGLNSGMMILQYTTAALASENKVLAHPASVDSIPTSANVEDLVSMGTIAVRKAKSIIENVKKVLAIEAIVACQAIDFRLKKGYKLGTKTKKIYEIIRKSVPFFTEDNIYYPYIAKISALMDKNFPISAATVK